MNLDEFVNSLSQTLTLKKCHLPSDLCFVVFLKWATSEKRWKTHRFLFFFWTGNGWDTSWKECRDCEFSHQHFWVWILNRGGQRLGSFAGPLFVVWMVRTAFLSNQGDWARTNQERIRGTQTVSINIQTWGWCWPIWVSLFEMMHLFFISLKLTYFLKIDPGKGDSY